MSSRMGSVTLATTYAAGEWETYRASKAALNMLARCFYQRHHDEGRTLLIMHPGWVKTDMGGEDAPVDLTASVEGLYSTLRSGAAAARKPMSIMKAMCCLGSAIAKSVTITPGPP